MVIIIKTYPANKKRKNNIKRRMLKNNSWVLLPLIIIIIIILYIQDNNIIYHKCNVEFCFFFYCSPINVCIVRWHFNSGISTVPNPIPLIFVCTVSTRSYITGVRENQTSVYNITNRNWCFFLYESQNPTQTYPGLICRNEFRCIVCILSPVKHIRVDNENLRIMDNWSITQ